MMTLLKQFQATPGRGVVVGPRLAHWSELLDKWCAVHERYCCQVEGDAIFWYTERSNIGALAAAAWLCDKWVAMEEFSHARTVKGCGAAGRADLFLKSPVSEDYVESKYVWCREGKKARIARARKGLWSAYKDARSLRIDEEDAGVRRVAVLFAAPSCPVGDQGKLPSALTKFLAAMEELDLDAAAWSFPPGADSRCEDKREYPGVFLLAKLVS